ncbi:hypothetical protein [Synechococcus sp. CBW1107]|uniref:hypothetical protein n=1 Tax=Synechococcus sp. CBW1107 TaxID=2789857 RepID=UPI002AD4A7EA|nr:hypothetical protein [Synechococcus sp. CBW1107]CAK6688504.1 hypothetical protein MNNICLKF_00431 [Synechococcus sp. CBW1107]
MVLQRLLLLPLLSPLLVVLLVAAINPKPWVKVRLLTWSSASLPVGGWIAAAATIGAVLSGAGTALALQEQGSGLLPRRQVRRSRGSEPPMGSDGTTAAPHQNEGWGEEQAKPSAWAGPARRAGEPAPTVSVPFRVIRKGSATQPAQSAKTTPAEPASTTSADDWGTSQSDDW